MKEIVSYVSDSLKQQSKGTDTHVYFSKPYETIALDKDHFSNVGERSDKPLTFVDGGNAELLSSSQFSLQLIRVYGCSYSKGKKVNSKRTQFYCFVQAGKKEGKLSYYAKLFGCPLLDEKDFCFEFSNEEAKELGISAIGQLIRRCAELAFAAELVSSFETEQILVLDGSLQCTGLIEKKYMDALLDKTNKTKTMIGALSKTTGLVTNAGNSIASVLSSFNISGKWLYYPVVVIDDDLHRAELSFVKLHEKSRYVFKFEIDKDKKQHLKDVVGNLSSLSSDSVFLGYPYGLVDADMHSRISKAEKQQLALQFKVSMGKDWSLIENSLNSANAHEILDKMSYGNN